MPNMVVVTITRPGLTTTMLRDFPTIDQANGEKADVGASTNLTTVIAAPCVTAGGLLVCAIVFYFMRRRAVSSKYGVDDIFSQPVNQSSDPFLTPLPYHDQLHGYSKEYGTPGGEHQQYHQGFVQPKDEHQQPYQAYSPTSSEQPYEAYAAPSNEQPYQAYAPSHGGQQHYQDYAQDDAPYREYGHAEDRYRDYGRR
ncbi:hypothetical protein EC988_009484 [Linderina pennispora]|nr:hypothetical protein EC988_009484 [Linderina pennispora]